MKLFGRNQYKLECKLLFDNTQELLLLFDLTGKVIECNKKAIIELGYGTELYHVPIYEIFKNVFLMEQNKLIINNKYQDKVEESIAYRKNQTCFPVLIKVEIVTDKKRTLGVCSAVDITKRKEAMRASKQVNKELEEYQQVRNEFVANITHELRTPVNGIVGLSDNLLDTELTPYQAETVNLIKRCCNGMNTLINDLLDYAKISSNKMTLEEIEFNFHDFIKQVIELNRSKITEKGLKLLVNISNEIPNKVIGDEFRLTQILNNLFSNAIKFTAVGQIALEVVKLSQTDRYIELFFMMIDTGIGIGAEEKERIFQSFSQEDGSISRRFGGSGLGLAICKNLVEAMQGTIQVDSIKNKGSNFSFSVKLVLPSAVTEYRGISGQDSDAIMERGIFDNTKYAEALSGQEKDELGIRLGKAIDKEEPKSTDNQPPEDNWGDINEVLEKLSLCIVMENWEKAEELSGYLKNKINQPEIKKELFRLLLAVRKESYDSSLKIIMEIRSNLNEVNEWRQ